MKCGLWKTRVAIKVHFHYVIEYVSTGVVVDGVIHQTPSDVVITIENEILYVRGILRAVSVSFKIV